MGLIFKQGDAVTIKHTTLTGVIQGAVVVDDGIQYMTNYNDNDGNPQHRYFDEDGLVLIPPVDQAV